MSVTAENVNHDAIVIGGGIGGLAFAALAGGVLGKKILIVEKNAAVGKDGEISWKHVRPMTSYKGEIFAFPRGLEGRIPQDQFTRLMSLMREMVQMDNAASRKLDDVDLRTYVTGKGVTDPLALSCINNITMVYVCVPDYRSSTGEFIRCLREEARSRASGYPAGGCSAVSEALADGIRKNGGDILTKSEVTGIIVENGRAQGVRSKNAAHRAPIVVSNADGRRTLLDLLPEGTLPEDTRRHVEGMTYSYSMLIVRMALKHRVTDHRLITHIANFDPRKNEEDLLAGKFPDEVNLFMPVPSNFSPECAPEGRQLLTAGVWVPYGAPDMERLEEIVVHTAGRILPGLEEAIMWRHVTTPENLHRMVGENGAIIGLGQSVGQVGKNRLSVETAVPGLYLCGAESGGTGVGIELAIDSAYELLDRLGKKDASWQLPGTPVL